MIKSPKEKFQESQIRTGQWASIFLSNPLFDEACDAAMLQLLASMPTDASSHYQMMGAQRFVRILKTIHEKNEQPKETTNKGLNYQAGV